jgi:hypothetical protein
MLAEEELKSIFSKKLGCKGLEGGIVSNNIKISYSGRS